MLKNCRWTVCLALVVLVLDGSAHPAAAQLTRGFVSGTITDASNAILPGVQITITNNATNIMREAVSSDTGLYRFVAVEPGAYSVEFKLSGFVARRVDTITVGPAQEVVVNQTMAVGGVTTEIAV